MIFTKTVIYEKTGAYIEEYIHSDHEELAYGKRRAMMICPGGGYSFLSEREAEPVALKFFAAGFNVFVLRYSVNEKASSLNPLCEALLSVKYLRENAGKYCLFEDKIFIGGFSAGGHLAASAGTMYKIPEIENIVGHDRRLCRPDGMILCYPVITGKSFSHGGSIKRLVGKNDPTQQECDFYSTEDYIDGDTPPAYIWHTAGDRCVPVLNSFVFAENLSKFNIPFELHIFPSGPHGLSLCNKETWSQYQELIVPYNEGWIDEAIAFAEKY